MSLDVAASNVLMTEANQEISRLSSKLSQVSDKFVNQWTGETLAQFLRQNEARLRQFIRQAEDEIEVIKQEMGQLKQQASDKQLAVAGQQTRAKEIQTAIEGAEAKTEQLLFQIEQWKKQLEEETKQCKEQKELLDAQEKATRQRLEALNKSEKFFKDRMGFGFRKIDGDHLQFVFTNLDSKAHDRSFYITLRIDNNQYQVTDCCPAIEGLSELASALNKTNDLMKFVVEARKKFKLTT